MRPLLKTGCASACAPLQEKRVVCEEVFVNESFTLPYDFLVMAVGTSTPRHRMPPY